MSRAPSQLSHTIEQNLTSLYLSSWASWFSLSRASGQLVHLVVQKSAEVVRWRWPEFPRTVTIAIGSPLTNDSIFPSECGLCRCELGCAKVGQGQIGKVRGRGHFGLSGVRKARLATCLVRSGL
ncbi:hypothetical protein THAOC_04350 [Thalassiosira oceanica]|uniref:Uncharacterized protein n=1 Tax=Thalassiosira oceanica TaxID=159749 RepID=K0T5E8_THAOC|nr:hypothetical protein THAOC_04350 [Thalassiosira oceanica]|eukprot:EJK73998.1 hypothetical protein THAOC_04350 [Thalassiosira oceanica]